MSGSQIIIILISNDLNLGIFTFLFLYIAQPVLVRQLEKLGGYAEVFFYHGVLLIAQFVIFSSFFFYT